MERQSLNAQYSSHVSTVQYEPFKLVCRSFHVDFSPLRPPHLSRPLILDAVVACSGWDHKAAFGTCRQLLASTIARLLQRLLP